MATTPTLYPTTVASATGTTWTNTANATGSTTGTVATFTNAAAGGVGVLQLSGYAAQTAIGNASAVVSSVALTLNSYVAATNRWTSVTAQLYSGTTAIGAAQAVTLATGTGNSQTITFTGSNAPTYAQCADLRVQVTATHTTTTSSTYNVDTAGLAVTWAIPGPKTSTLTDTFTTLDTSKWTATPGTSGSVTVSGGRLLINTGATNDYPQLATATTYDLTGSAFYTQVIGLAPSAGTTETMMGVRLDANNLVGLYVDGNGFLQRRITTGGTATNTNIGTYSAATHGTWFRLRESGGSVFYDTSLDGTTWTNQGSVAVPWSLVAVTPFLTAGHWSAEASGTSTFDNVNTVPPVSATANVALAGSGTLTAVVPGTSGFGVDPFGTSAFGGGGGTASTTVAATLSGSGTLSATTAINATSPATLAGAGTLTATATPGLARTGSFSGAGTLTADTSGTVTTTGQATGSGTLTATASYTLTVAASLNGAGALGAATAANGAQAAALTGSGALTATVAAVSVSAALSGTSTLAATGSPALTATGNLSGSGALAGSTVAEGGASANLSGVGVLTATTATTLAVAANLQAAGTLTAATTGGASATATLTGSGTLTAISRPGYTVAATLTGSGKLAASGGGRDITVQWGPGQSRGAAFSAVASRQTLIGAGVSRTTTVRPEE